MTWSGKVHVWEGAAEAVLVSGKKGQLVAVPAGAAMPVWAVLTRPFVAFAHPRVILEGARETEALVRSWFTLSGWKHKPGAAMIVHVIDSWEGGLSQIEIQALEEMAKRLGFRRAIIVEGGPELIDPQILKLARTSDLPNPYRPTDALVRP